MRGVRRFAHYHGMSRTKPHDDHKLWSDSELAYSLTNEFRV